MDTNLEAYVSRSLTSYDASEQEVIGDYAFARCKELTTVENTDDIKSIGDFAFTEAFPKTESDDLGHICEAEFPNVESIGDYAFWRCDGLKKITLGNCKEIGTGAFSSCGSLEEIEGLEEVEKIGIDALHSTRLTSLNLRKLRNVRKFISKNSTRLETADVSGARNIDEGAFEGCTSLSSISAQSIDRLGKGAFKGCSSLIVFASKNLNRIGEKPFEGCTSMTDVYIGGRLTEDYGDLHTYLFGDTEFDEDPIIHITRSDFDSYVEEEGITCFDKVGGFIFDLGGATYSDGEYHFYDNSFEEILDWETTSDLRDAVYYSCSDYSLKKIKVATLLKHPYQEKPWGDRGTRVVEVEEDEPLPTSEQMFPIALDKDVAEDSMWTFVDGLNGERFKDIYLVDNWWDDNGVSPWFIGSKEEYDKLREEGFFESEDAVSLDHWACDEANGSYGWKYYHWMKESEWGVFKALCELYLKNLYKTTEEESEWGLHPKMYHTPCADFVENNDSLDAYAELKKTGLVKLEDFEELLEYPSEDDDSEPYLKEDARITPLMCIRRAYDDCIRGIQSFTVDPYFITRSRDYYGVVEEDAEPFFYKVGNTRRFQPETQTMTIITYMTEYTLDGEKNILPIHGTAHDEDTDDLLEVMSSEATPKFVEFLSGKGETFEEVIHAVYPSYGGTEFEGIPNDDDIVFSYEDDDGATHEVTLSQDLMNIPTVVTDVRSGEYSYTSRNRTPCRFNNTFMNDWNCKGREMNTGSWYKTTKRAYAHMVPVRNI